MRSGQKTITGVSVVIGIAALLIWAFVQGRKELATEEERERPVKAPLRVSTEDGETVVKLDQATQEKSGIATSLLKAVSHQEEMKAYGLVMDLRPLVDLRNSFAMAKAQVAKAGASLDASRKEYERLKLLQENQNISAKVFQAAEAAWRSDQANAEAAETALHVLTEAARQRWGAVLAQWLFDDAKGFERLIQRQDVLLQITFPPASRPSTTPGNARVQTPEGRLAPVSLVSPAPSTDPRIQGMSFFYAAQAQMSGLLPGMNVLAYVPRGSQVRGVIVPAGAVVWWQGEAWIYVQKGSDHFVRRGIATEMPVENGWFVGKGLAPGDRVVVRGAQLLLSEEFRAQIQISD
jgi:hypothetical protein